MTRRNRRGEQRKEKEGQSRTHLSLSARMGALIVILLLTLAWREGTADQNNRVDIKQVHPAGIYFENKNSKKANRYYKK